MSSAAAKLKQRLSGYWKMEAGNVVLLPAILIMLTRWNPSWIALVCLVPMMFMLAVGAYYWRIKLKQLEDKSFRFASAVRIISGCQMPAVLMILIGLIALVYGWVGAGHFTGAWDQGVATFAVIMAILEYVNYYHRQLQHFDHGPDFKRLLSGKGLRASQMAKDLKTYRRT